MNQRTMIVAGVMSGTSADGVNVALIEIGGAEIGDQEPSHSGSEHESTQHLPRIRLLAHAEYPYPSEVRSAILNSMNAERARVADLARLSFLLGELYAEAVLAAQRRFHLRAELVGCHGQTLYHQGDSGKFLGRKVSATWQIGEAAVVAARVGAPVVSDFRPADMAAAGKGAPLVPFLDYAFFRQPQFGRTLQNIGGIANLTAIPAAATLEQVIAFDTGPGNMVIDAAMEALFGRKYDRGGQIAASGKILEPALRRSLQHPFFRMKPPKTAGREEFGREFVRDFLRRCGRARKQDVIATATALTAQSIAGAVQRFVIPKNNERQNSFREMIVSGGGARNRTLIAMLKKSLAPLGIDLRLSDEFGLPSEAKEAVAFALLAYETWNRRPSNVPSATGAKQPAMLGKITYV
jgi:anhydro-N-acetylmuramic acid kinase